MTTTSAHPSPTPDPGPRQPWLHELVLAVDGNVTALSDRRGAMGAPGTGLVVDDRRVLSVLDMWLGEHPTDAVVARAAGDRVQVWGSARHLGDVGADPTVEVLRTRVVRGGHTSMMTETVTVRSRAAAPVRTTLTVLVGGDGASLHDVKSGLTGGELLPVLAVTTGEGTDLSWSDERHTTRVRSRVAPVRTVVGDEGPAVLVYAVDVAPGGVATIDIEVEAVRLEPSGFDADAASARVDWSDARVEADDPRLRRLVDRSLDDLRHLLLDDPQERGDVFAAAGSPWYLTLFGRDSLWSARMALPFSLDLAAGTLATLARRQGRVDDPTSAEEPGKILHEVRRETFVDDAHGLHLPPVYYGTVDATALWVCLLHDAWRHGLPDDVVRGHLPALAAAMGWVERRAAASDDGLLRYVDRTGTGLANQGWKDSGDSMRRADGSIAPAPIALVEAQAYAVEAARGAAALAEAFGTGDPDRWTTLADDLVARVRDRFWVERAGARYLAMAVDGDGALVDGIGSNMGHVLGTGTLTAQEAATVADVLTGADLLGPHGISTLSRSNPAYNPIGYHTGSVWTHDTAICAVGLAREGHAAQAGAVVRALVDAGAELDYRWPELYSGDPVLGAPAPYPASCRPQAWSAASAPALVTALLGLDVDVPSGEVRLRPVPGAPFGELRVAGLVYGDHRFAVAVARDGSVRVDGLPDGVRVVVG